MARWLSGVRGAALMVPIWMVGWGLGFGGLAEAFVDPDGKTLDIWPAEMAIPGFFGGIIFGALLLVFESRRGFDQAPLVRMSAWGVVSGLVLAVLTIATDGPIPLDLTAAEMLGLGAGLGLVAGFGSGIFFRGAATLLTPSPRRAS
jgi:hypothetical protein